MLALPLLLESTEQIALEMVWDQWSELGAPTASQQQRKPRKSLVDPEALLLASICLLSLDKQLREAVRWWISAGSTMTSITRLKRLLPLFPSSAESMLARVADLAVASQDLRWATLTTGNTIRRLEPTEDTVAVVNPAALVLRMRLIFGINPTADIITYLLGRGRQAATVRQISATTAYARSSVHRVLDSLVAAKIAGRNRTHPATFELCAEGWLELLGRGVIRTDGRGRVGFRRGHLKKTAAPMWLCWSQLFSLLTILRDAIRCAQTSSKPLRGIMMEAWRHFDAHRKVFWENNLMLISLNPYGDQYIESLLDNISKISAWYASDT